MRLRWTQGNGNWTAESQRPTTRMDRYKWVVNLFPNGNYGVCRSDRILTYRRNTFNTLEDAQKWCQIKETQILKRNSAHVKA